MARSRRAARALTTSVPPPAVASLAALAAPVRGDDQAVAAFSEIAVGSGSVIG